MHNSAFSKLAVQGLSKGANVVSFISTDSRQNAKCGKDDGHKLRLPKNASHFSDDDIAAWFGLAMNSLIEMVIVWLTKSPFVKNLTS